MHTDEQLKASLKEVGALTAALDERAIVAITDPQGRNTHVNDKFCAITKYAREELLGQDHRLTNSDFHPTEFIRDLPSTIAHGCVWRGEIRDQAGRFRQPLRGVAELGHYRLLVNQSPK